MVGESQTVYAHHVTSLDEARQCFVYKDDQLFFEIQRSTRSEYVVVVGFLDDVAVKTAINGIRASSGYKNPVLVSGHVTVRSNGKLDENLYSTDERMRVRRVLDDKSNNITERFKTVKTEN
ncbi:MAG: hypothetical protein V1659_02445 [Candidatus Woesearchaeota archaeon]